jgi:DNA-binding phage protein
MTPNGNQEAAWIAIVRADVAMTGSTSKTASRAGVSRGALAAVLNKTASSPYVNGKASTANLEEKVMNTIGMVACPFLSEYHGAEHRITGLQCREYAYRNNPPTSIPRDMQHWRACQNCDRRVKDAAPAAHTVKSHTAAVRKAVEPQQQAGVIDKVTLPLPEVGAPQVGMEAA